MAEPPDLARLKRAFFAAESRDSRPAVDGIMFNMPLCRAPREILPYHQRVLNVSEPQHTPKLTRTPRGLRRVRTGYAYQPPALGT